jgi:hypothetical protein
MRWAGSILSGVSGGMRYPAINFAYLLLVYLKLTVNLHACALSLCFALIAVTANAVENRGQAGDIELWRAPVIAANEMARSWRK